MLVGVGLACRWKCVVGKGGHALMRWSMRDSVREESGGWWC